MKKFLVLQLRPEDETADSEYAAIMRIGGLAREETERIRVEQTGISHDLDPSTYAAIIVGGSPFDISTPSDKKSPLQLQIEADFNTLLTKVVTYDIPFLGCCSGNGLLGNYCKATISPTYAESVGGVDIAITKEGLSDKLLHGLPTPFRALVGHKEACDTVPADAVLLASSSTCPVQMFRIKENVYATQFHPEADSDEFILRITTYKNHGYFPPQDAAALIEKVSSEDTPVAQEILKRFVAHYRANASVA